jgi:hypothetical protein
MALVGLQVPCTTCVSSTAVLRRASALTSSVELLQPRLSQQVVSFDVHTTVFHVACAGLGACYFMEEIHRNSCLVGVNWIFKVLHRWQL